MSCIYDSPVGRLRLEATQEGICAVRWLKDDEESEKIRESDSTDSALARRHLSTCTTWLSAYFNGSLLKSPVPRPPLVIPMKGMNTTSVSLSTVGTLYYNG